MSRITARVLAVLIVILCAVPLVGAASERVTRQFPAASGGKLVLDLDAGGTVKVTGAGGSGITVSYSVDGDGGDPTIEFEETGDGLKIVTKFRSRNTHQSSNIDLEVSVPDRFDIEIDSMGGGLHVDGVEGTFEGKTMGGEILLRHVRGDAHLKTMGGEIEVTESELDGSVETMGGEVTLRRITGDLNGSSMGGEVRYVQVYRRDGSIAGPKQLDLEDVRGVTEDTVQIFTMGGGIDVDEAPSGVAVHTMGGDIDIADARGFAKVTTMGGDIDIQSVDGWVIATTMGGDIEVHVAGSGGDVELQSMSGVVTLVVPAGFSMDLDIEVAFTRSSDRDYKIDTDFALDQSVSPDWDYAQGSPRRYIRAVGAVDGGGNKVKIRTVNGDIHVRHGRAH